MSVSSTKSTIAYAGDGTTKNFAYPYYYFDKAHLTITTLLAGVQANPVVGDYDVIGTVDADFSAYSGGGTVEFVTAPAANTKILIQRRTPKISIANFVQYDDLRATDLNHALDYLTLQSQEGPGGDVFKGFIAQAPDWGTWAVDDWFILTPATAGEVWAIICTTAGTGALAAWRGFGGISLG